MDELEALNRAPFVLALLTLLAFVMLLSGGLIGGAWRWQYAVLGICDVAMGALFTAAYYVPRRSEARDWVLRNRRLAILVVVTLWVLSTGTVAWVFWGPVDY